MRHYIPYFTAQRRQLLQALCGEFITIARHHNEPDCPTCKELLGQKEEEDSATAVALEGEFKEFEGKLVSPDDRSHI